MNPDLRRLLVQAGAIDAWGHPIPPPPPDARRLTKLLSQEKPTPESFKALFELLNATDRRRHGELLVALFGTGVHPWLFQAALALIWKSGGGCRVVVDAAGSRERLKAWFAHARFDWPADEVVAELITVWTPREMTLYRGGRGDPAKLAAEYSWTPIRAIAARYALNNPHPHPDADGEPVTVRRVVKRSEIALKWVHADQETILLDPGPFEVDCTDVDEMADLAEEARQLQEQYRAQRAAFIERHRQRGELAL